MSLYQHGMSLKALLENPDLLVPPKQDTDGKKDKDGGSAVDNLFLGQSAFLGPQLWDKTYDESDLKFEFMDLDEFLNENDLAEKLVGCPSSSPPQLLDVKYNLPHQLSRGISSPIQQPQSSPPLPSINPNLINQVDIPQKSSIPNPQMSPVQLGETASSVTVPDDSTDNLDYMSGDEMGEDFDPTCRKFSAEELRPQPLIKKSRKQFVPNDMKDEKYWARRRKNNIAAQRSRDARRTKENQIAMRALYLEQQSDTFCNEVEVLKKENAILRQRLAKYEPEVLNE